MLLHMHSSLDEHLYEINYVYKLFTKRFVLLFNKKINSTENDSSFVCIFCIFEFFQKTIQLENF
jgi:hypothetical protein